METHDDVVAQAVFKQLLSSARLLNIFEMTQLRSAYSGSTQYHQLSDSLRRKLRDLGLAAISASANRRP
jgi:hypothetical protein